MFFVHHVMQKFLKDVDYKKFFQHEGKCLGKFLRPHLLWGNFYDKTFIHFDFWDMLCLIVNRINWQPALIDNSMNRLLVSLVHVSLSLLARLYYCFLKRNTTWAWANVVARLTTPQYWTWLASPVDNRLRVSKSNDREK